MQMQAIAKGMALGLTAGTIGYLVSNTSGNERTKLKRRTVKAMHAIGAVMDSVSDFLR